MWINEYFDRPHIVQALCGIRSEWEEAADGASLARVDGSVGMLLADITSAIGLTSEEQVQVLGTSLASELQEELLTVSGGNIKI